MLAVARVAAAAHTFHPEGASRSNNNDPAAMREVVVLYYITVVGVRLQTSQN